MPSGSCYLEHRQLLFWGGSQELFFLQGVLLQGNTVGVPHCRMPFTLGGTHNHTEAKVEEGGEVRCRVKQRGVAECHCQEVAAGPPGACPSVFLRWKSPAAARHWISKSQLSSQLSGPRRRSPPATGRVGLGARGTSGPPPLGLPPPSAQPLAFWAAPAKLAPLTHPDWSLCSGLSSRALSSRVWGSISHPNQSYRRAHLHGNICKPYPLAGRLAFCFGALDTTSEAENLKKFLPLLGQGTLDWEDEAAAAESCVSS